MIQQEVAKKRDYAKILARHIIRGRKKYETSNKEKCKAVNTKSFSKEEEEEEEEEKQNKFTSWGVRVRARDVL